MNTLHQDEILELKLKHNKLKLIKKDFFIKNISFIIILVILILLLNKMKNLEIFFIKNINNIEKIMTIKKAKLVYLTNDEIDYNQNMLEFESQILYLSEINKKRIFDKRYPLPKEINCYEYIREGGLSDLMAFTSFLTKNTTFFEFGSGCTTIIAKFYANKSYAVEGNREWYEKGIKKGLKENLIFKDIKPDGNGKLWSTPGKESNLEDWKNYFQSYKKDYNADVILIDGRFRVACAFDIFNKIKENTIILIHEYFRPQYIIIEKYYDYIYHWNTLYMFKKKSNINQIPLDFQKNFWNDST